MEVLAPETLPCDGHQHSYRHAPGLRIKHDDDASPKSVIADMRFISPASSTSSSMDRRPISDRAIHILKWQPRHDRGYSISDGDFSDTDTFVDSTGTSRELAKVGYSGPLESLPETHSLDLEATRCNNAGAAPKNTIMKSTLAVAGTSDCRCLLLPSPGYQEISITTCSRGLRTAVSVSQIPPNEWSRTATASGSTSELDVGVESSSNSSAGSESEYQLKETQSFRLKVKGGLSPEAPVPDRPTDAKTRGPVHPSYLGNMGGADYAATTPRCLLGWQAHMGSPPSLGQLSAGSPGAEKGIYGAYSPASLPDMSRGLPFQHRFLSGPMVPRPPPSKWDDAEKWIVSPGHHESPAHPAQQRFVQTIPPGRRQIGGQVLRSNYGVLSSPECSTPKAYLQKPPSPPTNEIVFSPRVGGIQSRSTSLKKRSKTISFGDLTLKFDLSRSTGKQLAPLKRGDAHLISRSTGKQLAPLKRGDVHLMSRSTGKPPAPHGAKAELNESEISETAGISRDAFLDESVSVHLSDEACSYSLKDDGTDPSQPPDPSSSHSPYMFMGTQLTPIESQRNSTCNTPFITSPTRHNTPAARSGRRPVAMWAPPGAGVLELKTCHLAKLQEIRKLEGDGQPTLMAWSSREEEDLESSARLRQYIDFGHISDAEGEDDRKFTERYNQEAAKVSAWEELQKAKAEAEMQKLEAKIEKLRIDSYEKMRRRMVRTAKKAEELRTVAKNSRAKQAAKTALRAKRIRICGRLSYRVSRCCFVA